MSSTENTGHSVQLGWSYFFAKKTNISFYLITYFAISNQIRNFAPVMSTLYF